MNWNGPVFRAMGPRLAGLTVALCVCGPSFAQYLEPDEYRGRQPRGFTAGVMARDFAPRASNTEQDSVRIRYSRLMPVLSYRQGPVEVQFGYATYTLNGLSRAAVFFGTMFTNDVPIAGSKRSALVVPLMIAADYTKAEAAGPQRENFNVASIGLGAGLRFRRIEEWVDWSVSADAVAHYSFEGFSTGSGFSGAVIAETVAFFPGLGLLDGLIAGYRFRYQSWSLRDGLFDYRVITHGPFVGVML